MDINALLTVGQAAQAVGVSKQLITYWHNTGTLVSAGANTKGHRLYRLRDVQDRELKARNSTKSPRRVDIAALLAAM